MQSSPLPFARPRAVAEIDTHALSHNFRAVSRACGKTIAVVKADAYGHALSLAVPAPPSYIRTFSGRWDAIASFTCG